MHMLLLFLAVIAAIAACPRFLPPLPLPLRKMEEKGQEKLKRILTIAPSVTSVGRTDNGNEQGRRRRMGRGVATILVLRLASLMSSSKPRTPIVIVQLVAAIGSFAYGIEGSVQAVIDVSVVPCLIVVLSQGLPRLSLMLLPRRKS